MLDSPVRFLQDFVFDCFDHIACAQMFMPPAKKNRPRMITLSAHSRVENFIEKPKQNSGCVSVCACTKIALRYVNVFFFFFCFVLEVYMNLCLRISKIPRCDFRIS